MEALTVAILVIGGIVGAIFVYTKLDSALAGLTGRGMGEWIEAIWVAAMCVGIGFVGVWLLKWGMSDNIVLLTIIGLVVAGVGFLMAIASLTGWAGGYPDSMSGKTKHYGSDGKLRGYSDKE